MSNKPEFLTKYTKGQQAICMVTMLLFAATIVITMVNVFENFVAIVCVFLLAFVMFALLFIVLSFVAYGGRVMGGGNRTFYLEQATLEQRRMMDNLNRWTWVLLFLWIGILLCYVVVISSFRLPGSSLAIYAMLGCGLLSMTPMAVVSGKVLGWRRELGLHRKKPEEDD